MTLYTRPRPALLRALQPIGCQHPQSADITTPCSAHRRHMCATCGAEWYDLEVRR